jgi:hypothetical protein
VAVPRSLEVSNGSKAPSNRLWHTIDRRVRTHTRTRMFRRRYSGGCLHLSGTHFQEAFSTRARASVGVICQETEDCKPQVRYRCLHNVCGSSEVANSTKNVNIFWIFFVKCCPYMQNIIRPRQIFLWVPSRCLTYTELRNSTNNELVVIDPNKPGKSMNIP